MFEKVEHFENWQKWSFCKGYSLCMMHGQFGSKYKKCKNDSPSTLQLIYAKNGSNKQIIFDS